MARKNELCESIGEIGSVQAVFLVNDGSIVHWKAKKGVKVPAPKELDKLVVRSQMILSLAGMEEGTHGRFHYNLSRYDDSDILLFNTPVGKKSMLMVMMKNPYELERLLHGIQDALKC